MTGQSYLTSLSLMLTLCLSACSPAAAPSASQFMFNPVRAFSGHSHGDGTLSVVFQAPQPYHVESHGFARADGTFRLDQTVTFAGKPPQKRHWVLREVSPTHYAGTLSDAEGPVEGHIRESQFGLVYPLPGGLTMHQTLTLEPSGEVIDNVGRITFLGMRVGYLHETIERRHALRQASF